MTTDDQWISTNDPKFIALVDHAVQHVIETGAWNEMGDAGVGSEAAIKRMFSLLQESKVHRRRLLDISHDLMTSAAEWVDRGRDRPDQRSTAEFEADVFGQIATLASCYIVIGLVVGILSCANAEAELAEEP